MINFTYSYGVFYNYKLFGSSDYTLDGGCSSVCFGNLFGKLRARQADKNGELSGNINVEVATNEQNKTNNKLILSPNELHESVEMINGIFKNSLISYSFINDSSGNPFKVAYNVQFDNVKPIYIMTVLTFLRYLFEQPYNIIFKGAILLKNYEGFKDFDFFERFSIFHECLTYGTGHSLSSYYTMPFNQSEFQKRIDDYMINGKMVNYLFDINGKMNAQYDKRSNPVVLKNIDDDNIIVDEVINAAIYVRDLYIKFRESIKSDN